MLFSRLSSELRLEISLNDRSGSAVKAKIMCVPIDKNVQKTKEQQIWWEGSKFGSEERNKLRKLIPDETFIPDIQVNSSNRYRCILMSPRSNIDKDHLRKRIHRAITASVPAKFGSCSPGYRLHQERCYPCPPGTFTSGQETNCNLCPVNFYNNKEAADSCYPCPEAKKTLAEGADSEDLCVYLDTAGRPISTLSTKLLVIAICAAIFIVVAWILIGLYLYWWYRGKYLKKAEEGEKGSEEDHVYSEIGEDNTYIEILPEEGDGYEVPKKPDRDTTYTEILPDDDGYEVPKKPSYDDHIYETINEEKDYNMQEQPKTSASKNGSTEKKSSSNKIQAIDNDYYYVDKENGITGRKTSQPSKEDTQQLIDDNFEEMYANADAVPTAREHRGHLLKTESSGFQPLFSPDEEGRLQVKKSDFNQLAKIILRTSKSETDAWAGNRVPNLEELGYDVAKLSKVIEKLSEKVGSDEMSEEQLEVPSRSKTAQARRVSESVVKVPKTEMLKNVLQGKKEDMSLRTEDFDFKSRDKKGQKNTENSKSSEKVDSASKVHRSESLPHKSISKVVSDQSDVDTEFSADTDTNN
ncbi:uncharacterized protein LOC129966358 [Argiope bruennichi]|uniref:uncharacterized protein LOC129966358 n=1 Tax=Argiope bruennichi TaxID=94029 RepID=UPI002495926D|nr:uncharacterized protein LOC129966358 [Argiope bruennichi]